MSSREAWGISGWRHGAVVQGEAGPGRWREGGRHSSDRTGRGRAPGVPEGGDQPARTGRGSGGQASAAHHPGQPSARLLGSTMLSPALIHGPSCSRLPPATCQGPGRTAHHQENMLWCCGPQGGGSLSQAQWAPPGDRRSHLTISCSGSWAASSSCLLPSLVINTFYFLKPQH